MTPCSSNCWSLHRSQCGSVGAAVAQDPVVATGSENVWLTLKSWPDECNRGSLGPDHTAGEGDGFEWLRGFETGCEVTFSDPRVSGTVTQVWNEDWHKTGKARGVLLAWGQEELTGPSGSWSGWFHEIERSRDGVLRHVPRPDRRWRLRRPDVHLGAVRPSEVHRVRRPGPHLRGWPTARVRACRSTPPSNPISPPRLPADSR